MSDSDATAANALNANPGDSKQEFFQCGSCKRTYKRLDHLARHVRSHTQSRPYKCQVCSKAFGRVDLLKRHSASHASRGDASESSRPGRGAQPPSARVAQACKACASNHLRCTEQKPCQRCRKKGFKCDWSGQTNWNPTASESNQKQLPANLDPPTPNSSQVSQQGQPADLQSIEGQHRNADQQLPGNSCMAAPGPPSDSFAHLRGGIDALTPLSHAARLLPSFDYFATGFPPLDLPGSRGLGNNLDLDTSASFDLNEIDWRFLDTYNESVPFEFASICSPLSTQGRVHAPELPQGAARTAATATATLRSCWRFNPDALDNSGNEEKNLSLPSLANNATSPESLVSSSRRMTCAKLSASMRDKILVMVLRSCRDEKFAKAVAYFPSAELLDSLLQYYLSSPMVRADSFVHAATFDPNERRPELVAAMAAAGAVLTSDTALTKLGLAIQECLRLVLGEQWERNNVLVRDLQLSQAFVICLEMAVWSGHSRKVEIAESFLQTGLTMLRRNNKFKRIGYQDIMLQKDDVGERLQSTWHAWAHQESFKRLAFRMQRHDIDSSIALLTCPHLSYAEMTLPLPDSPDLWLAPTAEKWKEGYLRRCGFQQLPVLQYFNDPHTVSSRSDVVDAFVGNMSYLSCLWVMSWEIMQLSCLQVAVPGAWNTLLTTSRREEVLRLLERFRLSLDTNSPHVRETFMRLEVVGLHLHMSLEDIQNFAGMEGPEQSRAIWPTVLAWAKSEAGRRAVWHAGQITLAAKLLPKNTIYGPLAVILSHATMALWAYGLLAEPPDQLALGGGPLALSMMAGDHEDVWLDGQDGMALQRFVQYGRGRPCIRGLADPSSHADSDCRVYLSGTDGVIDTVTGIIRGNCSGAERPHLNEKLIQHLQGLQLSSRRAGTT